MRLELSDGRVFSGRAVGAERSVRGELVFQTGMTGYAETLTDPSYRGQILVFTYPLLGNYGVPDGPWESDRVQVEGVVVSSVTDGHHFAKSRRWVDWLKEAGVPAIADVDTRALTRHLRAHGTMQASLLQESAVAAEAVDMERVVELVTPREVVRYPGGDIKLLVVDTGAKESILQSFRERGATLIRVPFHHAWERMIDEVDGVVLTNGPGDPSSLGPLVAQIRGVLARGKPIFGVCLGHQLLALAAGGRTYKMKYGHRSQNQPVIELATRRAFVTSQNHGYAVDESSLPRDFEPWFVNLNDRTSEGIRHGFRPFRSVQFHPEAAAGPHDTKFLFDDFLAIVGAVRGGGR